ncbi:MAG: ABC transporter permease subunit [Actinobacteria bacterium]|nr:MAG: ABC transporter permease subunit [Actinomycetota bacterium]REK34028.1 MAG: ABC transporter permease subunit [Actinomycetota bacterium]
MRDVRIPPLQLGLAIIGVPVGIAVGLIATNAVRTLVEDLPDSALLHGGLTIALAYAAVRLLRVAVPLPGEQRSRTIRVLAQIVVGLLILLAGQTLARFAVIGGAWAAENLGAFDFLGEFVATNGDILAAAFGVAAALAGAVVFGLLGSKLGYQVAGRMAPSARGVIAVTLTAAAGALVALGVGQAIGWLYQIENSQTTVVIPAIVGALIGAAVGVIGVRRGQLGAGLGVYYTSRTIFNTLRSIEPLVMVIVFVIWVGLGPFAGALALGLHTVAALTKLYSEQVESINPGPVEAVRATGATRLQTVVYGVVPQIVAPYISFTMYRWDINVRMSTIIGFGGGGGIGFLLQQNIGLLNYRAAAAQMLAIAIVVASMDYISSRLRERYT